MAANKETLPPLRQDLHLFRGTRRYDGVPTWTLFDPVRNRYFQLLERDFHILSCWQHRVVRKVARVASERAGYEIGEEEVDALLEFLVEAELLDASRSSIRRSLSRHFDSKQTRWVDFVLYKYLFFRLPLVRPDTFLNHLWPLVRPLFSAGFIRFSFIVGALAWLLVFRHFDEFLASFASYFTLHGVILFFITLFLVKVIHELGHGLACKKYGLKVPTMGVAFLVLWPVLYTDASDAWRLQSRRERAIIASAGILSELVLACYALLLWVLLPEGLMRDALFIVATTSWVLSLLVNLNPLLRFDGYYFLSDALNVPNLQTRSFRFGKWHLRNLLFGLNAPPPEQFSPALSRFLVFFAWAVWIYRFFLFLAIALLVYHLFFKVLGIFLFVVEIYYFIIRPIKNELAEWKGAFREADRRRLLVSGSLAGLVLLVLFYPWQSRVVAPAVLGDEQMYRVFTALPGRVEKVDVAPGERVEQGQSLVRFSDPGRFLQARVYARELDRAEELARTAVWFDEYQDDRLVIEQRRQQAAINYHVWQTESQRLLMSAPREGVVVDMIHDLHPGRWIGQATHVLTLLEGRRGSVTAWFTESDIQVMGEPDTAWFYPVAAHGLSRYALTGGRIDLNAVSDINPPYHASTYGGNISVTEEDDALQPERALYRGQFRVGGQPRDLRLKGWVHVRGERRSLAGRVWRWFWGVLLRESGF